MIIFTDLDGTLLDSNYSFAAAAPALDLLRKNSVPLIFCSSKTRAEIEHCRKRLKNIHPFIPENGGGVFSPAGYFPLMVRGQGFRVRHEEGYSVIKLGRDYSELRRALLELRSEGFEVTGFGDMSIKEVSALTGLKPVDAARSKERSFDEPFVFRGDTQDPERLRKRIEARGLSFTQGEFFHIMGNSDKGRAVEILAGLYRKKFGDIVTIALGDSVNDIEMLERADYAVVIKKPDGTYNPEVVRRVKGCIKSGGIGPAGWNRAVLKLVHQFGIE